MKEIFSEDESLQELKRPEEKERLLVDQKLPGPKRRKFKSIGKIKNLKPKYRG